MKKWLVAFRLRTLPLALACIGMGSFLAASKGIFQWSIFGLCLLTAALLQILSNLANDYGDAIHGADGAQRKGPKRAVSSGAITKSAMRNAIVICAILALVSGISLLLSANLSQTDWMYFLAMGGVAIVAAITYTAGKNPYGYAGLGDVSVFLFFGWLGVAGSYYLHTLAFDWLVLLPATACSCFTVAVLNVNNIRDINSDTIAGKKSVPVRLGRKKAVGYHWTLLVVGFLCAIVFTILTYQNPFQFLFVVVLPMLYINGKAVQTKLEESELDPYLKQMSITTLVFVLTFGIGLLL